MGNSKNMTVSTELGEVVVHKMLLSEYAELLRALDKLPKHIGKLVSDKGGSNDVNREELVMMLPALAADSLEELASVLSIPTDKDAAFIMGLDGADTIELFDAVLEVNQFERIVSAVKKILARRTAKTIQDPAKS
jgi:hypothetical protein